MFYDCRVRKAPAIDNCAGATIDEFYRNLESCMTRALAHIVVQVLHPDIEDQVAVHTLSKEPDLFERSTPRQPIVHENGKASRRAIRP